LILPEIGFGIERLMSRKSNMHIIIISSSKIRVKSYQYGNNYTTEKCK